MLTVSDVKQYPYCPRIVYYTYLLPLRARPTTYKMLEGKLEHERTTELEERRSLRAYGLTEGVRHLDVALTSERLGLRGRLDMIIEALSEVIPVDFKNSEGRVGLNHKYQLTAYALLVEEAWRRPVRRGFIYLVPQKRAQEVRISSNMRGWVHKALREIRDTLAREATPAPTRVRSRCTDCEFRNLCPDVW
ncbi:MAG: CRISPR-associated protein Cas4 [Chloroflexi bacterium]|nr:CRISPR-associated protein Cas4 [Chloroflexota bacterium]